VADVRGDERGNGAELLEHRELLCVHVSILFY
jgi:hypothetical protein